ncbi:MAG TPA: peptidase dimerization domain-containing protein, partial [Tepidiformaceae bacterium]|nr:peptidase dimerization domain-containing protein [Tepidiformaceae bacterium]
FGKNAHAAAMPWQGVNALDALVMGYNAVSVLRQQMRPTDRVHGVFTAAGLKPNIIPDYTAAEYYVRAATMGELDELPGASALPSNQAPPPPAAAPKSPSKGSRTRT